MYPINANFIFIILVIMEVEEYQKLISENLVLIVKQ